MAGFESPIIGEENTHRLRQVYIQLGVAIMGIIGRKPKVELGYIGQVERRPPENFL